MKPAGCYGIAVLKECQKEARLDTYPRFLEVSKEAVRSEEHGGYLGGKGPGHERSKKGYVPPVGGKGEGG